MITGLAKRRNKHLVLSFSFNGENDNSARQLVEETLKANHFEIKPDTKPDKLVARDSGSTNPVADAATALTAIGERSVVIDNILAILGQLHSIGTSSPCP